MRRRLRPVARPWRWPAIRPRPRRRRKPSPARSCPRPSSTSETSSATPSPPRARRDSRQSSPATTRRPCSAPGDAGQKLQGKDGRPAGGQFGQGLRFAQRIAQADDDLSRAEAAADRPRRPRGWPPPHGPEAGCRQRTPLPAWRRSSPPCPHTACPESPPTGQPRFGSGLPGPLWSAKERSPAPGPRVVRRETFLEQLQLS